MAQRRFGRVPRSLNIDDRPVGVYVHIPFCRKKCAYCDFYSVTDPSAVGRYADALCRHIGEAARHSSAAVDTIYFGGGTPTVVGVATLCKILRTIKRKWSVTKTAEITIEANPESCDKATLKRLRRGGFNRLSLGIQSLCDAELASLGRIHSSDTALRAFADARAAGFANISIDVMYGFEGQTAASLQSTLDGIIALRPEHISAYALTVEEGTPLASRGFEPDGDVQADTYSQICDTLRQAGFAHYEVSNWAQRGYESKHNSRYWALSPYIGFGPSAASDMGGSRFVCVRDIGAYIEGIEKGDAVLAENERIADADRAFEYVMLALRTSRGVGFDELRRYRLDPEPAQPLFDRLQHDGLLERLDGAVRLTEAGWLVSNRLILEVAEALPPLRGYTGGVL